MFLLRKRFRCAATFALLAGGIAFFGHAFPAAGAELPPELAFLAPLLTDEEAFVKTIRDYHNEQKTRARGEREAAEEAHKQGDAEKARALATAARERMVLVRKGYEIGLALFGGNARLHNYYGELLYDEFGEKPGALRHWNLALSFDPKLGPAHNNLGLHYFHNGQYDLGLNHMEEALRLEKKNPDFLFNMAQIYLIHWPQIQARRNISKKAIFRRAMRMSKAATRYAQNDYDLLVDYAVNFYAGERFGVNVCWSRAADAWQKARAMARNDVEQFYTWLNEGRVWLYGKKYAKAEACLEEALRMRPDSETAQTLLQRARTRSQPEQANR